MAAELASVLLLPVVAAQVLSVSIRPAASLVVLLLAIFGVREGSASLDIVLRIVLPSQHHVRLIRR